MADVDNKDILKELQELTRKIEKLEKKIELISRETGTREGRNLSDQVDEILEFMKSQKREIDEILIDTRNIRKVQEFGNKDLDEIKKALAAIYRNTDEIEKNITPDERETWG